MTNETNQSTMQQQPQPEDILNQDGKVFIGVPNPNKSSMVKTIYTNEKGTQICSAMRASGTKVCTSTILRENGRCKKHGGMSLSGASAPSFKTGRYSKNLPIRLASRYEEALSDAELNDLTEDLAIIDTRLADLFHQLDEGGGGEIFAEVKDAYRSFKYASNDGDKQVMRESLRRLEDAINRGSKDAYLWTEIRLLQEQRRKIVLAEAKRLQITNQTVTVTKVNLLISALLDSVRRHITDRKVLSDISHDFMRITNAGAKQLKS
jgi:hypothetical protein